MRHNRRFVIGMVCAVALLAAIAGVHWFLIPSIYNLFDISDDLSKTDCSAEVGKYVKATGLLSYEDDSKTYFIDIGSNQKLLVRFKNGSETYSSQKISIRGILRQHNDSYIIDDAAINQDYQTVDN